jgi:ribosomal protein S18 acetylase RimI-like enzyme
LEDIKEIKNLHLEWFPIRYYDDFYEKIYSREIESVIMEIETKNFGRKSSLKLDLENNENNEKNENKIKIPEKLIIGFISYSKREINFNYIESSWYQFILGQNNNFAYYIMTIGVVNELRGKGVSKMMLEYLK